MNKTTLTTTAAIAMLLTGLSMNLAADSDSKETAETVIDIYTEVAEDVGMSLEMTLPELRTTEPLLINGDKELLIQMLANLIENSIRYCPVGVTICIDAKQRMSAANKRQIQLLVTDNGPGIPVKEQERVFQRLYRLDKSRSDQRGTGLGLSLIKAIIELADNEPGLKVVKQFPALTQS